MQISAKADYAVRSLVELAADSGRPLTCEGIASSQDIPFRFLKSVFRDLRQAGLVRSQRGCEGGYWIGRDPAAISVAEVMTAVDGEFLTLRGARPDTLKYPGAAQGLPDLWRAVEAAAQAVLGRTTIAELAAQGARADGAGREPGDGAGPARDVSPAVPASA
ncbi:RrF2 family transcriptional regulator [Streptomyces scopuliridis]|uniref:RrF2 family transcriptional regulator n=1 Tax=Streptomyces scopuliridis TaxID=452529 RepID=UPI0036C3445B